MPIHDTGMKSRTETIPDAVPEALGQFQVEEGTLQIGCRAILMAEKPFLNPDGKRSDRRIGPDGLYNFFGKRRREKIVRQEKAQKKDASAPQYFRPADQPAPIGSRVNAHEFGQVTDPV